MCGRIETPPQYTRKCAMNNKVSIPKLHSIKYKNGIMAGGVESHPDKFRYIAELHDRISDVIQDYGNMSTAEVVGVLERVKKEYL